MTSLHQPLALVVIAGPQASGKSTLASALSSDLRNDGEQVALVELDQIAFMTTPKTFADWDAAHRIFESVVGQWARAGTTCVIAEGSGSKDEVVRLLAQTPHNGAAITVATTVPFRVALARAQGDPTRGISQQYDFLGAVYDGWPHQLEEMAPDLTLDTNDQTIEECVAQVRAAMRTTRGA